MEPTIIEKVREYLDPRDIRAAVTELLETMAADAEVDVKVNRVKEIIEPSLAPLGITPYYDGTSVCVSITPEMLRSVRRALRDTLKVWSDRVDTINPYSETVYVTYQQEESQWLEPNLPIEISVRYSYDGFPKELLKEGCEFKRVDNSYMTLSCSVE